jgi:hypothetical protein
VTQGQGLKAFYPITQPITDNYITSTLAETKAWPFPQLLRGNSVTLLCFSDAIYTVDESTYVCTLADTKDAAYPSGSTSKAIAAGDDWHMIDMYGSWMLFNGSCVVFKTGRSTDVFVQDAVTIKTGCVHREGRILLGGFSASNFYTTVDWAAYWNNLAGNMPDEYDNLAETGPAGNWVWWSSFMAPDMLSLFLENVMLYASGETTPTTEYTADRPYIKDLAERNESGMRPMPFRNNVVGMQPLGEGVLVYGDDGIRYLASFNANGIHTYGCHTINGLGNYTGVLSGATARTAFAGDKNQQVFISDDASVWRVTADLQAQRLGYQEYISGMDQAKILLQYDPFHDEFYISDGSIGYLLNKSGLCRNPAMPTKLTAFSGTNLSSIKYATTDPTTMEIQSGTYTSPSGGIETITAVDIVGLNTASNGFVLKLLTRTKQTEDFYESASIDLGTRTRAVCDIPYLQYRWKLTAAVASGVTIENVVIETSTGLGYGIAAKLAASTPSAPSE